ncbi:MAG TPA: hypothetical protein VFY14_04625 [Streptomyces sp.]|nr:hypothetical protein [Streptomyces sp.]
MGSLRNPVGPLPAAIYWRRRAVVLALLVSLVLLVVWAVTSGGSGGDGGSDQGGGQGGSGAVSSITPGPSSSESLISEHPGGRDEVGGGTGGADGGTDGSGDPDGTGGRGGSGGGADGEGDGGTGGGSGPGTDGGANDGADTGVSVGAEAVPADSGLPDCGTGSVVVTLRSVENRYAPGKKPTFRLTLRNEGNRDCKVDFGNKATVFTITEAGSGDDRIWRSRDCPEGKGSALYRVPAGGTAVRTLEWDRRHSAPGCGTPGGTVEAGTYLIEAEVAGLKTVRTSFVLTKD